MSYFNHKYEKTFVGTQTTAGNPNVNLSNGFVITAGLPTITLNQTAAGGYSGNNLYGTGTWGVFDASTFKSVNAAGVSGCCPLIIAAASIYNQDSISPAIAGITETRKSRKIDPNKVAKFYRTNPCTGTQQVLHIGNTNYTKTLSPSNAACCFGFLCGESYDLRIDLKGSPIIRAFNHNVYQDITFYTGCCSGVVPTNVDSTLVFIGWANAILANPYLSIFLSPVVYDQSGNAWFAPGTTTYPGHTGAVNTWDTYVSPGYTTGKCGGMRLLAAYTPTNFLDCTFQYSDFYEIAPISIYASLIDRTGDPCTFSGICSITECYGLQTMGLGERALRDLIQYEEYETQGFNSDLRIREITLGNQELLAINRSSLYYRYSIEHYLVNTDNDVINQSMNAWRVDIITTVANPSFETFMSTWLAGCSGSCASLEIEACSPCTTLPV
jgi:hypothetical protein